MFESLPSFKLLVLLIAWKQTETILYNVEYLKKIFSIGNYHSWVSFYEQHYLKITAKNTWINIEHIKILFGNWQRKSESRFIEKTSQNNDFSIRSGEIQLRILHTQCNGIQIKKTKSHQTQNIFSHPFLFPQSPETTSHL